MGTDALPINARPDDGGVIAAFSTTMGLSRGPMGRAHQADWRHSQSERVSAAAMVVVLHAAAVALVMFSRSTRPMGDKPGLMAFDIPIAGQREPHRQVLRAAHRHVAQPLMTSPAPLVQVTKIDLDQSLGQFSPAVLTSADISSPAMPGGCDLTPLVQDALRHSDEVGRQLPAIPADHRSVANAIVVWNAGWVDPGDAPTQAALTAIRQTITQSVAAASAECRNQLQRGPRLVFLPGSTTLGSLSTMTVLAVGSGEWTWQQLIDGGQPVLAGAVLAASDQLPTPFATAPPAAASGGTRAVDALLASLIRNRSPTVQ